MTVLRDLIFVREKIEISSFGHKMKKMIMDEKKKFFDVWMYEVNEDIQSLAEAFGERFILQNAWIGYETCTHPGAKNLI